MENYQVIYESIVVIILILAFVVHAWIYYELNCGDAGIPIKPTKAPRPPVSPPKIK